MFGIFDDCDPAAIIADLNPIIFYRPVEFSKHSPDNALMGLNINYNFLVKLYSELNTDQKLKFNKSLQLTNSSISKVG